MTENKPFEITSAKAIAEGYPEPIWWTKACRQLGIHPTIEQAVGDNDRVFVRVIIPEVPPDVFWSIQQRAELLAGRDAMGLPTEELPSGGFPESDDEIADPIALKVGAEDGKVVLDFGRPIRAVRIHPVAASYLATLFTQAAFEADPDLAEKNMEDMQMQVQVATVSDVDGNVREAVVRLPSPFDTEEAEGGGENDGNPS